MNTDLGSLSEELMADNLQPFVGLGDSIFCVLIHVLVEVIS